MYLSQWKSLFLPRKFGNVQCNSQFIALAVSAKLNSRVWGKVCDMQADKHKRLVHGFFFNTIEFLGLKFTIQSLQCTKKSFKPLLFGYLKRKYSLKSLSFLSSLTGESACLWSLNLRALLNADELRFRHHLPCNYHHTLIYISLMPYKYPR